MNEIDKSKFNSSPKVKTKIKLSNIDMNIVINKNKIKSTNKGVIINRKKIGLPKKKIKKHEYYISQPNSLCIGLSKP